ncbi:signal recognition particle protein [Spiroplasma endosymbiont of Anurida maritima]|uniref:signal recognition particle protein n=1 Tax=Spiroplasma endosymbiont of Anurida maritima TaxID=2967972 RepID=UPI0036D33A5D
MFGEFLANRLKKSINKNIKKSTLSEETIALALKEIRLALLEADVNNEVVKIFIENVKEKAKYEYIQEGLRPDQMMIKIVHEEITTILGQKPYDVALTSKPSIIMMVGLQGSGKTTSTGKIANFLRKKKAKNPLLVGADIYRPAAIEQLQVIGKTLGITVFEKGKQDPVLTSKQAIQYANENGHDLIIIDTAGRLHIDEDLMQELKNIKTEVKPDEIFIVVDGMTGQDIINVTNSFNDLLKITGVIVTKLDGDARGGAVFSIRYLTKLPIAFVGTGEGLSNLQIFYPDRMADRILGMGDVQTLFEKAQENISERDMKKTMNRMMAGQFDLQDLLNQMKQISSMGKMGGIMKMMPGMPNVSEDRIVKAEEKLRIAEIILNSMTIKERREPRLIKQLNRRKRIVKGSGRNDKEYNELISQYEKTKKQVDQIAKQIKSGRMPNIPGMGNIGGLGF